MSFFTAYIEKRGDDCKPYIYNLARQLKLTKGLTHTNSSPEADY
jgi:hypothetical protein